MLEISLLVGMEELDFGHRHHLASAPHGASRPGHEIPAAKIAPLERFLRGFEPRSYHTKQKRGIHMDTSFLFGGDGGARTHDLFDVNEAR